jgi:KTSC domain-containing protein/uncharacterized protein DUF3761
VERLVIGLRSISRLIYFTTEALRRMKPIRLIGLLLGIACWAILVVTCSGPGERSTTESVQSTTLPTFGSYDDAIRYVTTSRSFSCDVLETSRSSFVAGAQYCSDKAGHSFAIFDLHGRQYIYAGVPSSTWQALKSAESFGSFYDRHFKGHFPLQLGNAQPKPSAICNDGAQVYELTRAGTCAGHGGVAQWLR